MTLKFRLLAAFTSIILVIILIFAISAYYISRNTAINQSVQFLTTLIIEEAVRIANKLPEDKINIDWQNIINNKEITSDGESNYVNDDKHTYIDFVISKGEIIASTSTLDVLFKSDYSDINLMDYINSAETSGYFEHKGYLYIWAKAAIPDTENMLFEIHHNDHQVDNSLNVLFGRLVVTAIILLWVAAWIILVFATRISRRMDAQTKRLKHLAHYDSLTDLPNRILLKEELEKQIDLLGVHGKQNVSLFVIDLDQFKEINDTLGHDVGDNIIKEVGKRLDDLLNEKEIIGRLGGDEFGIVLPGMNQYTAESLVSSIRYVLDVPFVMDEQTFNIDASIGIAIAPEHGTDAVTLIRHAEIAMYLAKGKGQGYAFYDVKNDPHSSDRLELIGELRRAIKEQELVLYFQPKLDLTSEQVVSAEALIRWNHPTRGIIYPDDFILFAERTEIIRNITRYVLNAAVKECARWHELGYHLSVAVNLAARNIQDEVTPGHVAEVLKKYNIDAKYLMLEITETAVVCDPERAIDIMDCLEQMGVKLSLDDFGTGYTSLSYIKRLPVDEIKIDRSFVMDMLADKGHSAVVSTIINFAHNLELTVVAEGVEDSAAKQELKKHGCDIVQGDFISPPMSADEFIKWLDKNQTPDLRTMTHL
ncbi:MAG: EAL domain-containing protein [Gammaproteobacteria bacterium]|nr:EAL domain-containing protein [Gammaproteobacteria bacterium]